MIKVISWLPWGRDSLSKHSCILFHTKLVLKRIRECKRKQDYQDKKMNAKNKEGSGSLLSFTQKQNMHYILEWTFILSFTSRQGYIIINTVLIHLEILWEESLIIVFPVFVCLEWVLRKTSFFSSWDSLDMHTFLSSLTHSVCHFG